VKHSYGVLQLLFAIGPLVVPTVACAATADGYPVRPVRIIVGYPPGGASDITARLIGQWLAERFGEPFVIENRPGASGNIATAAALNATSDGYTLLLVNAGNAINATLYGGLPFRFPQDVVAVSDIVRVPLVMQINPAVPVKSIPEFVSYAKAQAGKTNYGSAGTGTPQHVSAELFKMMTGVNMTHVPYRGSAPALTDLIGGHVQVVFDTTPASLQFIRTGKLRPLGVTTATRSPALPDVPAIGEFIAGYEASGWYGIGAPKNTPRAIVAMLNREINAGLADPRVRARLSDLGSEPAPMSSADFQQLMSLETSKWAKVVKFSGAKAD
jgi:tripartite-type tricarboxylate transporter receptor subunit TctC